MSSLMEPELTDSTSYLYLYWVAYREVKQISFTLQKVTKVSQFDPFLIVVEPFQTL